MRLFFRVTLIIWAAATVPAACRSDDPGSAARESANLTADAASISHEGPVVGVHVPLKGPKDVEALVGELPNLADIKINLLITEINYNFEFVSHPELRSDDAIPAADVRSLAAACRALGIRLVPQFQCLGHQSWGKKTHPLLAVYPQLDETPGRYPDNRGLYARSWCPLHPDVNRIVFALMDELLEAFEADALHVGLDEAFIVASEYCPRCRGKDPGKVFARAINDLYDHIVRVRGKEMFMWADRLLDASVMKYGKFEAAYNGTHPAVDLIPKDIILCDWHYEPRRTYPSIPFFLQKGFRVLPASYKNLAALNALVSYSLDQKNDRLLGHLATTWKSPRAGFVLGLPQIRLAARRITAPLRSPVPTLPPAAAE